MVHRGALDVLRIPCTIVLVEEGWVVTINYVVLRWPEINELVLQRHIQAIDPNCQNDGET